MKAPRKTPKGNTTMLQLILEEAEALKALIETSPKPQSRWNPYEVRAVNQLDLEILRLKRLRGRRATLTSKMLLGPIDPETDLPEPKD